MAQIAKEAGVSTTTVSKVLNELPGVGASTRVRIRQVIDQYDYVQNHAARNLRKGQSHLIDLVIMRLEGGYDLGIMRGIQDALEESGYRLVVFSTNENEASERCGCAACSTSLRTASCSCFLMSSSASPIP
jgi:LacI family transcriptional regulator